MWEGGNTNAFPTLLLIMSDTYRLYSVVAAVAAVPARARRVEVPGVRDAAAVLIT